MKQQCVWAYNIYLLNEQLPQQHTNLTWKNSASVPPVHESIFISVTSQ